jgi:hypothetical protein
MDRTNTPGLPPSGGWTGYYLYGSASAKHRMKMTLTFFLDGRISGDGLDDIAPFLIHGFFDTATSAANWTKAYVRGHTVEYRGLYDQRSICGNWVLSGMTGGFWIWPDSIGEEQALKAELELPVEDLVSAKSE